MARASGSERIDTASTIVAASPRTVYRVFLDPQAVPSWLPPAGMTCRLEAFDPREGGRFRMVLRYDDADHTAPGKTSAHEDVVEGRFTELVPDERVVQVVEFVSEDPAFAGEMIMTWTFVAVPGGTEVTIRCDDVPDGIRPEDHDAGLRSTLENLAAAVA